MGNNAAFNNFEKVVHACYKHGVLTKPLLKDIVKTFSDQDADSGGFEGITYKGKDLYDIVLEVAGVKIQPKPKLPKDSNIWTKKQDTLYEEWYEARSEAFYKIVKL